MRTHPHHFSLISAMTCIIVLGSMLRAQEGKAPNPHWKNDKCAECHTTDGGAPKTIPPENVDELCLRCHDGTQAAAEFHPVDRVLASANFTLPKGWPLVRERLVCITCHEVKLGCVEKPSRPAGNGAFLRDAKPPAPGQSQPFCAKCHQSNAYKKLNPHQMLLPQTNQIIDEKCLFCHTQKLDRATQERTGDAKLKTDQTTMCRDCHPRHKDAMLTGHLGLAIKEEMQAHIVARETAGLNAKLTPQIIEQARKSGQKPRLMLTDSKGTIVCSTCHNPHQAKVFPPDSALAYRAMRIAGNGKLASPVRTQAFCVHCHDF
jgi:predicted CXXCH cytochrome family protein